MARVIVVTRTMVIVPRPTRRHLRGFEAARSWLTHNRLWLVIVLLLSLLAVTAALAGGHYLRAAGGISLSALYEPKDEERRIFLERLQRERELRRREEQKWQFRFMSW
jgi:hypothetical protein